MPERIEGNEEDRKYRDTKSNPDIREKSRKHIVVFEGGKNKQFFTVRSGTSGEIYRVETADNCTCENRGVSHQKPCSHMLAVYRAKISYYKRLYDESNK